MSALLTWHRSAAASPPLSDYATTVQGMMQQLSAALTSFEGETNSSWEICSSELSSAPYYITLKRKTAAAGRILIMGFTGAVSPFNPQLQNYTPAAGHVNAAFFPLATSDTPTNISSASGDVFTNPGDSTGLGPNFYAATGTHRLRLYDCADGLVISVSATSLAALVFVGLLLDDRAETALPVSWKSASAYVSITPPGSIIATTAGGIAVDSTGRFFIGSGVSYDTSFASYLNDVANKQAYFLPSLMASYQRPYIDFSAYKFRQIALGFNPSVAYETLVVSGPTDSAYHVSGHTSAGTGLPWLTNFKV